VIDILRADSSQSFAVVRETPHLRNGALTLVASLVVALIAHAFAANALASTAARQPVLKTQIDQDDKRAQYVDDVEQYTTTLASIYHEVQSMRTSAHERVLITSSILNALPDYVAVSQLKRGQSGWELDGFVPDEGKIADLMETLRRVKKPYPVLSVEDGGGTQKGSRTSFTLKLMVAE
jgi:Tfp pilus assembly protein PilN